MNANQGEILLSSSTSVTQYREMEKMKDTKGIAAFVRERFCERYIRPFDKNKNKNGFIMMASACLMIESLESFWQGWRRSPNSALAFCQFFDRNSSRFSSIRGFAQEFYTHVRCGIMHQGETTGGWHIRRKGVLFDSTTKTINATMFLKVMESSLSDYRALLEKATWDSTQWKNLRKKMKDVCANTQANAS